MLRFDKLWNQSYKSYKLCIVLVHFVWHSFCQSSTPKCCRQDHVSWLCNSRDSQLQFLASMQKQQLVSQTAIKGSKVTNLQGTIAIGNCFLLMLCRLLFAFGSLQAIAHATSSSASAACGAFCSCTQLLWEAVSAITQAAASEASSQAVTTSVQEADAWGQDTGAFTLALLISLIQISSCHTIATSCICINDFILSFHLP